MYTNACRHERRMAGALEDWPVIYGQWLVNKTTKEAMSPRQVLILADYMEKYLDDINYRGKVDEQFVKDRNNAIIGQGRRRDPWPASKTVAGKSVICGAESDVKKLNVLKGDFTASQETAVRTWISAVRKRLFGLASLQISRPMDMPLCEYGYARNGVDRLKQHMAYHGTNYILSLARALLEQEMSVENIVLKQQIIYWIWKRSHAYLSEAIFTEIGLGYSSTGTGFSHHGAGTNQRSADEISHQTYLEFQSKIDEGPYFSNLKRMLKPRQEWLGLMREFEALRLGELPEREEVESRITLDAMKQWMAFIQASDIMRDARNIQRPEQESDEPATDDSDA